MNAAIINIKIDTQLKEEAQVVAKNLGFSLSSLVKAYLRNLVDTGTVHFSLNKEVPTQYTLSALADSKKDFETGACSPVFDKPADAVGWLHSKNKKKYANNIQPKIRKAVQKSTR